MANDQHWEGELDQLMARIGHLFPRSESRARARAYLQGLLLPGVRKTGAGIAAATDDPTLYATQQFLARPSWSPDALRDALQDYVGEQLAHPEAVLAVVEDAFPKKGESSAGAARQFVGDTRKEGLCQVGLFLAYLSPRGAALVDRALFLPEVWLANPRLCLGAGVDANTPFREKFDLAYDLLASALARGLPARAVVGTADEYNRPVLRRRLATLPVQVVISLPQPTTVPFLGRMRSWRDLSRHLFPTAWTGLNDRDHPPAITWQQLPLPGAVPPPWAQVVLAERVHGGPPHSSLLAIHPQTPLPLSTLVRAVYAPTRARELVASARTTVGLGDYQVRTWTGWHAHITLALLAHAVWGIGDRG